MTAARLFSEPEVVIEAEESRPASTPVVSPTSSVRDRLQEAETRMDLAARLLGRRPHSLEEANSVLAELGVQLPPPSGN